MNNKEVLEIFRQIITWKKNEQRAIHKPLLLLLTLARVQRGESRLISFEEIDTIFPDLIDTFGPPRNSKARTEDPFWRLQNDFGHFWDIPQAQDILKIPNAVIGGNVKISILKKTNPMGGFSKSFDSHFRQNPSLVHQLVKEILEAHFPESYFPDILDAIAMPEFPSPNKLKRSQTFRKDILRVYNYKCAICGYNGRLGNITIGLEAAHFKWHAAGGPDTISNGAALCSFHHKIFDRGAITLTNDHIIDVSQDVNGSSQVNDLILQYIGKKIHLPQVGQDKPAEQFITWHRKNVFKAPGRLVS